MSSIDIVCLCFQDLLVGPIFYDESEGNDSLELLRRLI